MQNIIFNQIKDDSLRIRVAQLLDIPAPQKNIEVVQLPARDGELTIDSGCYKSIEISAEFNYVGNNDTWWSTWQQAKRWLSAKDTTLILSDNPYYFYKVYYVTIDTNTRESLRIGKFKATFICNPYMYRTDGVVPADVTSEEILFIDTDHALIVDTDGSAIATTDKVILIDNHYAKSNPIYTVEGDGECYLQTINGYMRINLMQGSVTLDTDKEVAYLSNGDSANRLVTGDFSVLRLSEGANYITLESLANLSIIPNWREL